VLLTRSRAYELFLEKFRQPGCGFCAVLHAVVVEEVSAEASSAKEALRLLRSSCPSHAKILADRLQGDMAMLSEVFEQLLDALRESGRRSRGWRRFWRSSDREECAACRLATRLEPRILGWFLTWLGDMRFTRYFRVASPLCILHQGQALERTATASDLLGPIEHSKLDRLATAVVQHRHRGDDAEVMTAVRAFLVPTEATPPRGLPPANEEAPVTEEPSEAMDGLELVALRAEVEDLTQRLGASESRAASLQYQLATLKDENRDWERRYAALASESRILRAERASDSSDLGRGPRHKS
jgi:hypothetical protein